MSAQEKRPARRSSASKKPAGSLSHRVDLGSGVTLLVEESHAVPIVSIVVALAAGSAHDPAGKEGVLRFALRMLRRGCKGLTAAEIEDALDRLGGEISIDASTSSAVVYGQVIGRNLDAFIDLMARLMESPEFPEDEFGRLQRETVAELLEVQDNDRALAQRAFRRTLFAGHLYGRATGGTTASIQGLTSKDARASYTQHFVRGNALVGFAGDVSREKAESLTARLLEKIPAGAKAKDPVGEPSPLRGRHLVFVDKPERTQTQVLIGTLGTSPHDEDHISLSVANAVFGGTFTSRLTREIRSKRGWSYGVSSRLSVDRHRHAFNMWTHPAATDAPACIALELDLLEKLIASGVTPKETSFIKRYLTRSYAFEIDTATKRMHQLLDVDLLSLPPDYYSAYTEHVEAVTPETTNASITQRLSKDDLVIVVVGTASEIFESVKSAIPNLANATVVPFDQE
jgi:zinc protease